MLVLTRKRNESIMIGDDIELSIVAVEGDQVKIGIKAPKHIEVHRKEVYLEIQQANQEAAQSHVAVSVDLNEIMKKLKEK